MMMVCDDGENNNKRIHSKLTTKRALPTSNIVESMVMMLMMMLMMTRSENEDAYADDDDADGDADNDDDGDGDCSTSVSMIMFSFFFRHRLAISSPTVLKRAGSRRSKSSRNCAAPRAGSYPLMCRGGAQSGEPAIGGVATGLGHEAAVPLIRMPRL